LLVFYLLVFWAIWIKATETSTNKRITNKIAIVTKVPISTPAKIKAAKIG
jgi:hypothetical protein